MPEKEWYAGLNEREQKVMARLALFEGRVQALKNMREELYQSMLGPEGT